MSQPPVALITESQIAAALSPERSLELAAAAYRATATGDALESSLGHVAAPAGEFHIKGSGLRVNGRLYVAVKVGACFYGRPGELGRPSIVGLIQLFDGETGQPLAVMESALVTKLRTAAGTAVALDALARPGASRLLICGGGEQVAPHVEALAHLRPLTQITIWTRRPEQARAIRIAGVRAEGDLEKALADSDLVIGLTPATVPYLHRRDVAPGTTIAAVGSDAPEKRELALDLLQESALVCDVVHQCERVGELHHALAAGVVPRAEIGEVLTGRKPGRENDDEIVVFDSTGTAVQDTAAAVAIHLQTQGHPFNLWA